MSVLDCPFSFLCCVMFFSFVCLGPVSYVPNVASISGMSVLDCPFSFQGTIKNRHARDTGNIGHIRHRTKTYKTKKHNTTQKTEGTIKNRHARDTGNIGHIRHTRVRNCLPIWNTWVQYKCLVVSVLLIFLVFCVVLCCVVFFSFVCLGPVSYVPNVASISGMSVLDCPFSFLCCLGT
jgi:hypothetical protein